MRMLTTVFISYLSRGRVHTRSKTIAVLFLVSACSRRRCAVSVLVRCLYDVQQRLSLHQSACLCFICKCFVLWRTTHVLRAGLQCKIVKVREPQVTDNQSDVYVKRQLSRTIMFLKNIDIK